MKHSKAFIDTHNIDQRLAQKIKQQQKQREDERERERERVKRIHTGQLSVFEAGKIRKLSDFGKRW